MQKILVLTSLCLFALGAAVYPKQESKASIALPQLSPLPPAAGVITDAAPAAAPDVPATAPTASTTTRAPFQPVESPLAPVRLSIPSIGFNNPIIKVGTNSAGEMDVPDGRTRNVGWYKDGTLPGEIGNAVIGAHVYAAFARLDEVNVGDEIVVAMNDGSAKKFIVAERNTYRLSEMSADALFNLKDARRINLITCAGTLTPDKSTYTHRLVVSAIAV